METTESNRQRHFLARSEMAASRRLRRLWYRIGVVALSCILLVVLSVLIGLWVWPTRAEHQTAQAKYVWVQMLPDEPQLRGGRLVRAIVTEGDRCPTVVQDRKRLEMDRRPTPVRTAFPILICEAKLDGTGDAWVGMHRLPVRPADPRDIVVLGDTGCRMVHYDIAPQSCLDPARWPFAAISASAADAIGGTPAIIVHVGDFHYREHPCADSSKECGGSPYGDNWVTWEEEFFKPAHSLLLRAPWAIMRGNHENCARAGAGWLFFFALPSQRYDRACEHDMPIHSLSIGKTAGDRPRVLAVLDTAYEDDRHTVEKRCIEYRKWIDELGRSDAEVWLALHQPLWARNPDGWQDTTKPDPGPCAKERTKSALTAIRARFEASELKPLARLVLSGDLHVFQFFEPRDRNKPIQLVAGISGTKLDEVDPVATAGAPHEAKSKDSVARHDSDEDTEVNSYGVVGAALTIAQHGFVKLHRDEWTWTVKLLGVTGRTIASCRFSENPDTTRSEQAPDCPEKPDLRTAPKPASGLQSRAIPAAEN